MMRERLHAMLATMGLDELAVLYAVAEGLVRGRSVYGELHLDSDKRDMTAEALEELRDSQVYLAAAMVALQRRG